MTSSTHFTIDRLKTILEKRNLDELKKFFLREKGFRSEQYCEASNNWLLPHFVAGREFEKEEEADEWLSYAFLQQDVDRKSRRGMSVRGKAVDRCGNTPLHHACLFGSVFGVKWLVEHNAAVNSTNKWGKTPFMDACLSSINRFAKVRYLVEKGADCQAKDNLMRTALFYATKCKDDDVKEHLRFLVIESGFDINSVDKVGMTPLLYACKENASFVVIKQLIELGSNVSATDTWKQSALHKAAQATTDKSIIDLLIKKGADVTSRDKKGRSPHEVASDDKMKALLQKHYDTAIFCFPSDDVLVPENLMRTCAFIDASKWEDIAVLLGISSGEVEAVRNSTPRDVPRMLKILEAWKNQAESSPTVGKLLAWFKQVGISGRAIRRKFDELYG